MNHLHIKTYTYRFISLLIYIIGSEVYITNQFRQNKCEHKQQKTKSNKKTLNSNEEVKMVHNGQKIQTVTNSQT